MEQSVHVPEDLQRIDQRFSLEEEDLRDDFNENFNKKILTIQKAIRGWVIRKKFQFLKRA